MKVTDGMNDVSTSTSSGFAEVVHDTYSEVRVRLTQSLTVDYAYRVESLWPTGVP